MRTDVWFCYTFICQSLSLSLSPVETIRSIIARSCEPSKFKSPQKRGEIMREKQRDTFGMLSWISSSGEAAPLTGNSAAASSSVTEAVSDVSIYVGDRAQEAADSLKRCVMPLPIVLFIYMTYSSCSYVNSLRLSPINFFPG